MKMNLYYLRNVTLRYVTLGGEFHVGTVNLFVQ